MEQLASQQRVSVDLVSSSSSGGVIGFTRRWPIFSGVILIVIAFMAIFAPIIAPHDPGRSILSERNMPPVWYPEGTWKYPLGKDPIGRDVLSRVIAGARTSLMVVAVSIVVGTILGTGIGLVAGYYGGLIDEVLMRLVDIWYGIPFVMVALIVSIVVGPGLSTMMGLLAAASFAGFVRQIRAEVLSIKERDYIALARVAGASPARILLRHVLPGVINTVVVIATLSTGGLILAEAFLSFLGAGIPPPTPTWGAMVAGGREYLRTAWWITVVPGIGILLIVLALNFLGDWLRDRLDPRLRQVL